MPGETLSSEVANAPAAAGRRWVYDFAEGSADQRELLGGKGANLAEMVHVLGPELVPAGFTISTEACVEYLSAGGLPAGLNEQVRAAVERLERMAGKRLGDPTDPLLVSVRSGARDSMPGMLDTILNLGLNDESVAGLAMRSGDQRFAWDSYRRLVQMLGNVVFSIPGETFEAEIAAVKHARGVKLDTELDADDLGELTRRFQSLYEFPADPVEQLRLAIAAVFESWNGARAVEYRLINAIPDDWGTAVNVQRMVFGNHGETSGSGVAFSRDEVTGAPDPSGDFLANAQGEDVVSGVRTPRDLSELSDWLPDVHASLLDVLSRLERHFGDMQDCEFTVEDGRLYILQARSAKRPAQAAVRFATDAVDEGLLERSQALCTIEAESLDALLHPTLDAKCDYSVLARGVAASPGAARGQIVLTAEEAIARAEDGVDVILVRPFTDADDVGGFHAARGIITSEGGKASHAALVARGMGRPAVTGAAEIEVHLDQAEVTVGEVTLHPGDVVTIDGSLGTVTLDDVPLVAPHVDERFARLLSWADELRRLGVRTNADTGEDAVRAREFGAEGIGLCRTEHMFMGPERQPKMQALVVADDEVTRRAALDELLPLQQGDFEELFEAMQGLPVTIRLLDPPLHEFLPDRYEVLESFLRARFEGTWDFPELAREVEQLEGIGEVNPMLGTRGVRLGLIYPEIYEMQVRAIARALTAVGNRTGERPLVGVMIPLVAYERELELAVELVTRVAGEEGLRWPGDFEIGTMIELPRACLAAERLARLVDFFSFGTNDLTQTTLGFSRDDIEASIMRAYAEINVLSHSPFATIDVAGVGELVALAVERARRGSAGIETGVCGEHGGDPESIEFFESIGIDYVSCSPFRVPIARVAAAQASIRAAGTSN